MFGHSSQPSRNFSFGALQPTQGLDAIMRQLFLAHRYRNNLVELERLRRDKAADVLRLHFPELEKAEQEVADLDEKIKEIRKVIKAKNQRQRSRSAAKEDREQLRDLGQRRREALGRLKEMKAAAWESPQVQKDLEKVEDWANEEKKARRAACGLYWGTYLTVEHSLQGARKGPPPRFKKWRGEGKIAVQLIGGLTIADLLNGRDTRLRLVPAVGRPQPRRGNYATAWIRIGSNEDRSPVWATVPVLLHRPLPDDGVVKWAYLIRERVATHDRWKLVLTIARAVGYAKQDAATSGTVAVDLNWRKMPDGQLRVATWADDAGQVGHLFLSEVERWTKADSLRSIADRAFNKTKQFLTLQLLKLGRAVPDWLREVTKTIHLWNSHKKLVDVVLHWRDNRFPGDEEIFPKLEDWRKQDKHLYEWEINQRRKAIAWRDDLYRCFAAELRRRYKTVVLEDTNWREVQRVPTPETKDGKGGVRKNARIASVGRLGLYLVESMTETVKVAAANSTRRCHACKKLCKFDQQNELVHRCERCGLEWDQDVNAAKNLLTSYLDQLANNHGGARWQ